MTSDSLLTSIDLGIEILNYRLDQLALLVIILMLVISLIGAGLLIRWIVILSKQMVENIKEESR